MQKRRIYMILTGLLLMLALAGCGPRESEAGRGVDDRADETRVLTEAIAENAGSAVSAAGNEADIARLVHRLDENSRGGYFGRFAGPRCGVVRHVGNGVTLTPDGRLRVSTKTYPGDCDGGPDAEDWSLVALEDIDSGGVHLFGFNAAGVPTPDNRFESAAATAFCKAGPNCVERKDGRKDKQLYIPCHDGTDDFSRCDAVIRDLKALAAFYPGVSDWHR